MLMVMLDDDGGAGGVTIVDHHYRIRAQSSYSAKKDSIIRLIAAK